MWASGHPQHNQSLSSWNLLCLGRLGFLNRLFSPIFCAQLPKVLFSSKSNNKAFGLQQFWKSIILKDFLALKWAVPVEQTARFQNRTVSASSEGLVSCYLWLFSVICDLSCMQQHSYSLTASGDLTEGTSGLWKRIPIECLTQSHLLIRCLEPRKGTTVCLNLNKD